MTNAKRKIIRLAAFLLIAVIGLVCFTAETFAAGAALDYSKKGSLSVALIASDTEEGISGETLALYQVAAAAEVGGEDTVSLTEPFQESQVALDTLDLSDTQAKKLAAALGEYVKSHQVSGQKAVTDAEGKALWSGLPLGVYLVVSAGSEGAYEAVDPFIVVVPARVNGSYVYDIEAAPKHGTVKPVDPVEPQVPVTDDPAEPVTPQKPDQPEEQPAEPPAVETEKLPQTGQLWWPVPVLALSGAALVLLGRRRRENVKTAKAEVL